MFKYVALLCVLLSCGWPSQAQTTLSLPDLTTPPLVQMPMRVLHGLLVVQAEVDGQAGDFILDTGAPALVLHKARFAAPSESDAATSRQLRGVNGTGTRFGYYPVADFNWQGIAFHQHAVPTLDLTDLARRAGVPNLLGLIGYNLLSQYALTLDYAAQQLTLRQPTTEAPAGRAVPFTLRGHLAVVDATVAGQPLRLALDTGAQSNLLDARYAAQLRPQMQNAEQVRLSGADPSRRAATSGRLRKITLVHGPTFRKQATVFADIRHLNQKPDQDPLDGILGYPALRQQVTTIDYVNQQVYFQ